MVYYVLRNPASPARPWRHSGVEGRGEEGFACLIKVLTARCGLTIDQLL
jgi:hypothetical protein